MLRVQGIHKWLCALLVGAWFVFGVGQKGFAEDYSVPDPAEVSTYSPQALEFFQAGMKALDRVDYLNAFDLLSKAAQLQPEAVRLNLIVAGLGLKQGRSRPAPEARPFFETAISSLRNVVRQPALEDDFRRDVENRLRVALEERDMLLQRDARREALGGQFIVRLNREALGPTPRPSPKPPAPVAAAPTPGYVPAYSQGQIPAMPGVTPSGPIVPGAATPAAPGAVQMPSYPTGLPTASGMPAPAGAPVAPAITPGAGATPMPSAQH